MDEVARLREDVAALGRQLVESRRNAEELARVARLVSETLDLPTVGERIADTVLSLLNVHSSAIRLFRRDGMLEAIALGGRARHYGAVGNVVPPGIGVTGRAAVDGRPLWTADIRTDDRFELTPEIRARNAAAEIIAGLAVPLRVAGRVIGVVSVGSPTPRTFTDADIALLQTFADHAAIAITNAQTQEALVRQTARLQILHEIDRELIAGHDATAIAEAVLWRLRDVLGVTRAIVNVFDLAADEVEWLAAVGRRRMYRGPAIRYSMRLAGDIEALKRGEPQSFDVASLPPSPEADALRASGIRRYMVVPMIAGDELIGSVSFGGDQTEFSPEQIAIAQEAAASLGIALGQQRAQDRNRAKSEFLSRMSHELRTPLNAILGFAQLLDLEVTRPDEKESVGHILKAGRHLLGLINEVLDISRVEAGRIEMSPEPVPVHETLRQAMELVRQSAAAAGISLDIAGRDERLHVFADRQRLLQVFLNVLSNAIKYNRRGGGVVASYARTTGTRLRVMISDTGPGIPADKLPRVFTAFDRLGAEATTVEGSGLGLALSRSLVEAMGGSMGVQSEPGIGTTFFVELPLAPEPLAAIEDPGAETGAAGEDTPPRPARTVLYIEDNLSNLRLIERILSRRPDITLMSAMQGRVGIDLARDHHPDLILLDRHLPDMPGDDVFAQLRADARTRNIPVVMLSADAMPMGSRRLLEAGVRAYLTKPIDVPRLLATIDDSFPRNA